MGAAFAGPEWECLYVFGDTIGVNNIYDMSNFVEHYYKLIAANRPKKVNIIQKKGKFYSRAKNYVVRKIYSTMNF